MDNLLMVILGAAAGWSISFEALCYQEVICLYMRDNEIEQKAGNL